jgi:hypothetical protein
MALVVASLPTYSIEEGDNFDAFNDRLIGYYHAVGVNPDGAGGGPPNGRNRAMGILRSCLKGSVADWFDENVVGKNWKLKYFLARGGANVNALQALTVPQTNAGGTLHVNSLVAGSPADVYSRVAGNAGHTVRQAFIPGYVDVGLNGGDEQWERIGGEPTSDPVNAPNNAMGQGHPIVFLGIWPYQALSYMRRKLPPILEEKRKLQLNNLFQDNEPIRMYRKKIERAGKLLKLPQEVIDDYFYKGLSPNNIDETARMDPELPVFKVVDILEKIERRNSATRSGLSRRDTQRGLKRDVTATEVPPVAPQEPVELRQVTPQAIAQEQINKLLDKQADQITRKFQDQIQTFQAQFQTLQDKLSQQPAPRVPRRRHEFYEDHNPFDDRQQFSMDDIMGDDPKPNRKAIQLAQVFTRAMEKKRREKMNRQVDNLANALDNISIDDDYDPMDTSNIVYLCDEEGSTYSANLTRGTIKKSK